MRRYNYKNRDGRVDRSMDGRKDRRMADLLLYEFNIPYFYDESVAKNEVALLFVNQTRKEIP